jgi:hypothetical protein
MPFPITGRMDSNTFLNEIVNHYWGNDFADKIASPETRRIFTCRFPTDLPADYAKIGAFLSDKDRVEQALRMLEFEISMAVLKRGVTTLPMSYAGAETFVKPRKSGGSAAHLKSHKLLTNALRAFEAESGFNHERIQNGTFFDEAKKPQGRLHTTAAKGDARMSLTAVGKDTPDAKSSSLTDLARGAPTVLGDLDPLAFNVLLRHGYQFKDVAAGAYHGEYTHRLQWYAIGHANLGLANSLLDIYRSLGYMFAKATRNLPPPEDGRQLWMWQALFDTAESPRDAIRLRTVAHTTNGAIFTCPENMNKSLMSLDSNILSSHPLYLLKVLLKTRWKKRFDEAEDESRVTGIEKLQQHWRRNKVAMVVSSTEKKYMATVPIPVEGTRTVWEQRELTHQAQDVANAGYALAWYLRDDSVQ